MSRPRALTDEQKAKIVELYRVHGVGTTSIAERFGVSRPTVQQALRDAGVEMVPGRRELGGDGGSVGRMACTGVNRSRT